MALHAGGGEVEEGLFPGFVGHDPANQQSIFTIGCREDVENTVAGWWARYCADEQAWYATGWTADRCATYKLPDDIPDPSRQW